MNPFKRLRFKMAKKDKTFFVEFFIHPCIYPLIRPSSLQVLLDLNTFFAKLKMSQIICLKTVILSESEIFERSSLVQSSTRSFFRSLKTI